MRKKMLLSTLCSLIILGGCTKGSGTVKIGNELNTPTKMSMNYKKFNGHRKTQINVKEDKPLVIKVNITTESGTIDSYISKVKTENSEEKVVYEDYDIPTSTFDVTLSEKGKYIIRVDAKEHSGSYSFSWDK